MLPSELSPDGVAIIAHTALVKAIGYVIVIAVLK